MCNVKAGRFHKVFSASFSSLFGFFASWHWYCFDSVSLLSSQVQSESAAAAFPATSTFQPSQVSSCKTQNINTSPPPFAYFQFALRSMFVVQRHNMSKTWSWGTKHWLLECITFAFFCSKNNVYLEWMLFITLQVKKHSAELHRFCVCITAERSINKSAVTFWASAVAGSCFQTTKTALKIYCTADGQS